jgi:hypothetical protein
MYEEGITQKRKAPQCRSIKGVEAKKGVEVK